MQRAVSKVGNFVKLNYYNVKKIAFCPSEPDSANFTFAIDKKAAFEVLPVPDLTDLPGCNTMRQHALLPVVQSGHKRDAATQASNTGLNNKRRKRGKNCLHLESLWRSISHKRSRGKFGDEQVNVFVFSQCV